MTLGGQTAIAYLELHQVLRFLLYDDGAPGNMVSVADVAHMQSDHIAGAQLTIEGQDRRAPKATMISTRRLRATPGQ